LDSEGYLHAEPVVALVDKDSIYFMQALVSEVVVLDTGYILHNIEADKVD